MRKLIGLASGLAMSVALVSPALGATPATQACLGDTVRAAATAGVDFGQLVSAVATDDRGVGEEVQLIQAGEFPDEAFPNSCND